MTNVQAIILGLVQGLTEFLPISSSGHLILVPHILGWQDQGLAFDAMIHLGTAFATIYHYRRDCHGVLRAMFGRTEEADMRSLRNGILVATIPAVLVALLARDFIDAHTRNVTLVAVNLIIWAVLLFFADAFAARRDNAVWQTTKLKQAVVVGIAQVFALLPGTSRSGATISAGILSGMNRPSSVRFSFLMGLPIILMASAASAFKLFSEADSGQIFMMPLILGLVFSFLGGLAAIRILLRLLAYHGLTWFAVYRILLAAAILLWLR